MQILYSFKQELIWVIQKGKSMSNLGATLVKLSLLAFGATVGFIISNWIDEGLVQNTQTRSERDKSHYAQGLSPLRPKDQSDSKN